MPDRATDLARRLAERAEAVCRNYLPAGRRQGRYWLVGDVANAPGRNNEANSTELIEQKVTQRNAERNNAKPIGQAALVGGQGQSYSKTMQAQKAARLRSRTLDCTA